jgi:hypothetical protein
VGGFYFFEWRKNNMSTSNLYRWSGLASILCGLLLPIPWIMDIIFGKPTSMLSMSVDFVAITCIVFALFGIYSVQIKESGVYGFWGFVLTILMSCIGLSVITWSPQRPDLEGGAEMLVILLAISGLLGYVLLSIGSWKANKFPRWIVLLWPIGTVISGFGMMVEYLHVIGISVWGLGMIGAGGKLLSGMDLSAKQSEGTP